MESQIDTQVALNALDTYTTSITSYFTEAVPFVITLLMFALVVLLIWLGYKWFRRAVYNAEFNRTSEDDAKLEYYYEHRKEIEEEYGPLR